MKKSEVKEKWFFFKFSFYSCEPISLLLFLFLFLFPLNEGKILDWKVSVLQANIGVWWDFFLHTFFLIFIDFSRLLLLYIFYFILIIRKEDNPFYYFFFSCIQYKYIIFISYFILFLIYISVLLGKIEMCVEKYKLRKKNSFSIEI